MVQTFPQVLLWLVGLALTQEVHTVKASSCKVLPEDEEWPTPAEWEQFNVTVGGRLLGPVIPLSAPCHDNPSGLGSYDADECSKITASWHSTELHIHHPTSILYPLFSNNSCLHSTDRFSPCTRGYYPIYVVNISTPDQISATVSFAKAKNVRLNIKNTGHDFLGRSTGRGSLSIWTTHLKSIELIDSYAGETEYTGHAVKFGAGVSVLDLLEATDKADKMILGGAQRSVGVGGGFLAAGGHSPLSSRFGLAVDSVLEFDIVLANGSFVTATQKSYPDIFWAVRGGGGSTFGVVTSWTLRTFDTMPTTTIRMKFNASNEENYWKAVSTFLEITPNMGDQGVYSFVVLRNQVMHITALYGPNLTVAELDQLLNPFLERLHSDAIKYTKKSLHVTSFFPAFYETNAVTKAGWDAAMASRLIPRDVVENNLDSLVSELKKLSTFANGEPRVIYLMSFNPICTVEPNLCDNSVNPVWRKSVTHVVANLPQSRNMTMSDIKRRARLHVLDDFQPMRDLTPGSGAYMNEASDFEPDFQEAFYGVNYGRLYEIKQKYDPTGVFYATQAVGSENWTESDGVLCSNDGVEVKVD
ncbi:hypothetical protein AJ80_00614 [Polytolypa hystricis UAMH7299]|uniref:FAD-binding PCMH-type domain-containing protein n=1 Tax=Polytolypa hystricis (strain UAMH7299) TaxID=1447883 RepID=A0A2B7Z2M4_POLH7|nr:hypothetical protein AJ80_00614 [Polytolypa hystricis UAMH7299]